MIRIMCPDGTAEFSPKTRSHSLDISLMMKRVEPREFIKEPKKIRLVWLEVDVVKALVSKYLWENDEKVESLYGTLDTGIITQEIGQCIQYDQENGYPEGIEKTIAGMCYVKAPFGPLDLYLWTYYEHLVSQSLTLPSPNWEWEFNANLDAFEILGENYSTNSQWKKLWKYQK